MIYKVKFPGGYEVEDVRNDNIDTHIIVETGEVFFATLFTLENVKILIEIHNPPVFFWATDMLIVASLEKKIIKTTIDAIFDEGIFEVVFDKIGNIGSIYGGNETFKSLISEI